MPDEYRCRVWDLIDGWATSETDEEAKARLQSRIRRLTFTRRGLRDLDDGTRERARTAYTNLEPGDAVIRHAWLFADHWINLSVDETEKSDTKKQEREIRQLRDKAMTEIWETRGFEGVTALLVVGGLSDIVGVSLASTVENPADRIDFVLKCLSISGDLEKQMDSCLQGFLRFLGDDAREALIVSTAAHANTDRIVRLVRSAPFVRGTWRLLDRFGAGIRERYWREVTPERNRHSEAELAELIDRLIAAKRPRAAFGAAPWDWSLIETSRLKRLLFEAGAIDAEQKEWYRPGPYWISEALDVLDGRVGVTSDEMARLEFMYFDAIEDSEHGVPNLERGIAESPMFFVQVLAAAFKRDDDGEDPSEWKVEDLDRRRELAYDAQRLLERLGRVPGAGDDGKIDTRELVAWVTEARRLCAEYGRAEIGDRYIGQLLSNAPAEEDGTRPCLPVCEAMEAIESPKIGEGFNLGVQNNSDGTMRAVGEGGAQERALAEKYRNWAERRAFDYPHVAGVLESIAASYERLAKWMDDEENARSRLED